MVFQVSRGAMVVSWALKACIATRITTVEACVARIVPIGIAFMGVWVLHIGSAS